MLINHSNFRPGVRSILQYRQTKLAVRYMLISCFFINCMVNGNNTFTEFCTWPVCTPQYVHLINKAKMAVVFEKQEAKQAVARTADRTAAQQTTW